MMLYRRRLRFCLDGMDAGVPTCGGLRRCRLAIWLALAMVFLWAGTSIASAAPATPAGPSAFRVNLSLPSATGAYLVWATQPDGQVVLAPMKVPGPKGSVSVAAKGPVVLHVMDLASHTVALLNANAKASQEADLAVTPPEFTKAASVEVRVTSGGRPVSAAVVTLKDAAGLSQRRTLLPGQQGLVSFAEVAGGKATVKVTYDGDRTTVQDVEVSLVSPAAAKPIEVAVAGASLTESPQAAPSPAPRSSSRPATPPQPPTPTMSHLVGYVVALALVLVLALVGYYLVRSRTLTPETVLGKFGIKPEPQSQAQPAEAPPVQVPPGTCPFCGTPKDPVTGACACTVPASATPIATAAAISGPRLVVLTGENAGRAVPVREGGIVLGRDASCDLALVTDPAVSRRHALIAPSDGGFRITDEGSSNGTFVNGQRVTEAALVPGDEVTVGHTKLRFEA